MGKFHLVVSAALVLGAGCGSKKSGSGGGGGGKGSTATTIAKSDAIKGEEAPEPTALSAAHLAPIITEVGAAGTVPTAIVIELSQAITDPYNTGGASDQTVLKITPEVPGSLTITGVAEMTFYPARPLDFDTQYTVDLQAIGTPDGKAITAPAGAPWTHTFRTPKFALLGWAPVAFDATAHKVTMQVLFSGPILPNIMKAHTAFAAGGALVGSIGMLAARDTNQVLVTLESPKIVAGTKLAMTAKADIPSVTGPTLGQTVSLDATVPTEPILTIDNTMVQEGANGFFVEVTCTDGASTAARDAANAAAKAKRDAAKAAAAAAADAVDSADNEGGDDYPPYEGDDDYYYDSGPPPRCQLDGDALAQIEFVPPVKKAYITPGANGFRVFGDFPHGAVEMRIKAGAKTLDGAVLSAPFARAYAVSSRKPQLAFAASGRYLPRSAWSSLGVKHLNLDAVNLIVRHVPAENLVYYLGNEDSEAADDRTSDLILKKTIPLRGDYNVPTTSWVDLGALIPPQKGVLELKLVGINSRATSRLLLTNMSLVAKKTQAPDKPAAQTVQAWALDMDTSAPLDGVEISMVRKSGKVLAKCTTKSGAGCTLVADVANDPDETAPFALIAKKGDDLTYIRYSDLTSDTPETSTSGEPYVTDVPYRAALYADRGVYRPGDTAHVVAVIRDNKDKAPQKLPVDVQILDPRAKVVKKLSLTTNDAGLINVDQTFAAFADTGDYRVEFVVAEKHLATYDLDVEEFVPERMEVSAKPKLADEQMGDPVAIDVSARYLFGGSAQGSPVNVSCTVEPSTFTPDQNADYTYGVEETDTKPVTLGVTNATLDPNGAAAVACPALASSTAFTETASVSADISVLEAGSGRSTHSTAEVTLHPETFYLGARTKATRAVSGTPMTIEGIVVDWKGAVATAAPQKVQVELLHLESDYSYGYDYDSGESRYGRSLRRVPEGKQIVDVKGGKFTFDATPGDAASGYMIRLTAGKAVTELTLDGDYSYDYYGYSGYYTDMTPRPGRPTKLAVVAPKEGFSVGTPGKVSVKLPYNGKLLWTIETDHFVKSEWVDASGPTAEWNVKLDTFAPNVYVGAFLVKDPHADSKDAFLPDRAFGMAGVRVVPTEFTQALKIDVPTEVRSNAQLQVKLDAGAVQGPAFATVAVVDEGILSLTSFRTPDPLAQLFEQRRLGVETYETIGWTLLHPAQGNTSKTGGGDDYDADGIADGPDDLEGGRVQGIKPVALWSGVVPVGADGKVTVPFTLPTYRGKVRVMAYIATPSRVGSAEAEVLVRDPLVLQVTMPRFATMDDQIEIPVFLTNVSGGALDVSVDLSSTQIAVAGVTLPPNSPAPLAFQGEHGGTAKLADGGQQTLVFRAKVAVPIGGGSLKISARGTGPKGAVEVSDSIDLPLLPAGPKDRVRQKIKLEAGTLDLKTAATALQGWVPTSETSTFWVTSNPYGEAFDNLSYLVQYPFGCIEQTTSSARPLLYVADLVEQLDPEIGERRIEDMVLAGIDRILSMETPSGGFGYWPGSTEPEDWGTAYATHFLLDAKKAGYAVPQARLDSVLAWIEGRVAAYERGEVGARNGWDAMYNEQAEAYLQYVLAVAGKGHKARLAKLITKLPATAKGQQLEDKYLLEAALYVAGDRRYEKELKSPDTSPVAPERLNNWSFYSDRRARGLMLSTFFDLFGNDPAGELLATRVAEEISSQSPSYYTTQELVWGVTGLGKWVGGLGAKGVADGTLAAGGKDVKPKDVKHKTNDKSWTLRRASEYPSLTLQVPAKTAGMFLVVTSEGVRAGSGYKTGGNGLRVERTYKLLDGTAIDFGQASLPLGEVVFVEVDVTNTSDLDVSNLALVERLPACFEIENPRLGRDTKPAWVDENDIWGYDFMNMRDDKIEAFGALSGSTTRKIVYSVRAVTAGTCAIPPVELGAMYDPTLWARAKGGTAKVLGPWDAK